MRPILADETVKSKLANAKKLSDVSPDAYKAVLYVGGYGPVIDLPEDPVNIAFATEVSRNRSHLRSSLSYSLVVLCVLQTHRSCMSRPGVSYSSLPPLFRPF
jgi:hypothetical protein